MLGYSPLWSVLLDGLGALRSAGSSVGIGLPSLFSSALSSSPAAIFQVKLNETLHYQLL